MQTLFNTVEASLREFESVSEDASFQTVSERDAVIAVFFSRCRRSDTGCWLWTGPLNNAGYGYFKAVSDRKGKGRGDIAHRFSYELFKAKVPDGMFVLHSCDVRNCVNPSHLRIGTQLENVTDCIERGRFRPGGSKRGEANHLAKLTDADVIDIRNSTLSTKALSAKYGIDRTNVHQIVTGKTWAHVPMPDHSVERADGRAKLTRNQVRAIRTADDSISHGELASQYGVGVPLVCMIRKGRIWKDVAQME